MDNESWIIEDGDRIINKKAHSGFDALSSWERLVYSMWVADYGMRNAGDLECASELFANFQNVALESSSALALSVTSRLFALPLPAIENQYFDLFETVCNEIRNAKPITG